MGHQLQALARAQQQHLRRLRRPAGARTGLDLPPTAIGKDYLGPTTFVAMAPSGSGWQFSLAGLAGVTVAREEGLEFNLLGLGFGVDVNDARLRLPGLGLWPQATGL